MGNSNRRSSTGNTASDVSASATDAATAAVITANNISRPITDRISRLYVSEWSDTNIQRMIADGKLAPKTLACDVAASSFECPICFMDFEGLNKVKCCKQSICTDCFVRLRTTPSTASCPFCSCATLSVTFLVTPPNSSEPCTSASTTTCASSLNAHNLQGSTSASPSSGDGSGGGQGSHGSLDQQRERSGSLAERSSTSSAQSSKSRSSVSVHTYTTPEQERKLRSTSIDITSPAGSTSTTGRAGRGGSGGDAGGESGKGPSGGGVGSSGKASISDREALERHIRDQRKNFYEEDYVSQQQQHRYNMTGSPFRFSGLGSGSGNASSGAEGVAGLSSREYRRYPPGSTPTSRILEAHRAGSSSVYQRFRVDSSGRDAAATGRATGTATGTSAGMGGGSGDRMHGSQRQRHSSLSSANSSGNSANSFLGFFSRSGAEDDADDNDDDNDDDDLGSLGSDLSSDHPRHHPNSQRGGMIGSRTARISDEGTRLVSAISGLIGSQNVENISSIEQLEEIMLMEAIRLSMQEQEQAQLVRQEASTREEQEQEEHEEEAQQTAPEQTSDLQKEENTTQHVANRESGFSDKADKADKVDKVKNTEEELVLKPSGTDSSSCARDFEAAKADVGDDDDGNTEVVDKDTSNFKVGVDMSVDSTARGGTTATASAAENADGNGNGNGDCIARHAKDAVDTERPRLSSTGSIYDEVERIELEQALKLSLEDAQAITNPPPPPPPSTDDATA